MPDRAEAVAEAAVVGADYDAELTQALAFVQWVDDGRRVRKKRKYNQLWWQEPWLYSCDGHNLRRAQVPFYGRPGRVVRSGGVAPLLHRLPRSNAFLERSWTSVVEPLLDHLTRHCRPVSLTHVRQALDAGENVVVHLHGRVRTEWPKEVLEAAVAGDDLAWLGVEDNMAYLYGRLVDGREFVVSSFLPPVSEPRPKYRPAQDPTPRH